MQLCILIPDAADLGRYDDWRDQAAQIEPLLKARGVNVTYRPWSDEAAVDADLTLPLMAWGYHRHLSRWNAQLDRWAGLAFANPVAVLRWNTDKRYLFDCARHGVPIVPTRFHESMTAADLEAARIGFATDAVVVKPPVSAGSDDTWLLESEAPLPAAATGRAMLVQPMMPDIRTHGELSLFYLGGVLAHAIVKRPKGGDFRVQPQFGGQSETITPSDVARGVAEQALASVPGDLLYARVDLVGDGHGSYCVMEIELIEPWLYLNRAADAGAAFADAIAAACR
jgi:hypothetical protein